MEKDSAVVFRVCFCIIDRQETQELWISMSMENEVGLGHESLSAFLGILTVRGINYELTLH